MTLEIEIFGTGQSFFYYMRKKRVYVIVYRIFLHYIEETQFLDKNQNKLKKVIDILEK